MKKIFPEESTSRNQRPKRDLTDNIVDEIQAKIDQITSETNQRTKQVHEDAINHVQFTRNGKLPARSALSSVATLSSQRRRSNDYNHSTDAVLPFTHEDSMEEIKLSHELLNDEKELTQKLAERSNVLQSQLDDYYQLVQQINLKLKESESKYNDLEGRYSILEEEKAVLEGEVRRRPLNNSLLPTNPTTLTSIGNANKIKERDDLQKRSEELRKQLLFENDEDDIVITLDDLLKGKSLYTILQEFLTIIAPFKRDIRTIQARFGTSVASYFLFYRYFFTQCLVIGLFEVALFILHWVNMSNRGSSSWSLFSGELPYVMALSSFSTDEGVLYDFMILVPLVILLLSICVKLTSEDKIAKHLDAMDTENNRVYSKEVLAVWDNALIGGNDVEEYSASLANKYLQMLDETRTAGIKKKRSQYEVIRINFRRFLGMMYYLLVVGVSFSIIIYVTVNSSSITQSASKISFLSNFTSFIVTILLNIINGVTPAVLQKLTEVEEWDSAETAANIVLFRLYVSSLLNSLILAASYIVFSDPLLLANDGSVRDSISVRAATGFTCRFDQVGSGLFTLVILTWILDLFFLWATPFAFQVAEKYFPSLIGKEGGNANATEGAKEGNRDEEELAMVEGKEEKDGEQNFTNGSISRKGRTVSVSRRPVKVNSAISTRATTPAGSGANKIVSKKEPMRTEFVVASNMIKRLNFAGLILIAFPYCPSIFLLLPIMLFVGFKYEKFILKQYYSKPSRQWKGQKAGFVYASFYLFTFLSVGISVSSYFFVSTTFPKSCDIQDAHVGLCQSGTFDSSTNLCTINPGSEYASYYSSNYPASICNDACGPFIDDESNLTPFQTLVASSVVSSIIWDLCFSYPYIPWISCIILIMLITLRSNSIDVMKILSFNKERHLEAQVLSLEAERNKQVKIIQKLKTIEETSIKVE